MLDMPKQERTALVFRPDENLAGEIKEAFLWKYGFAGMENLPVKSSATGLMRAYEQALNVEAQEATFEKVFDADETNTGKEIGTAYHAFLEDFDFGLLYDEQGEFVEKDCLKAIIADACKRAKEEGRYAVKLLSEDKLLEILSNAVFKELRGKRLYKEQKFLVALPVGDTFAKVENALPAWKDNNEETVIFQGAIDLLAVGDEGDVQIIDYKFSKGGADYLKAHYESQLRLYRQATAKILGVAEDKIRCTIVNINHGFQVEMD